MTYLDILPHIKTLAFDVDGVLTDGSVKLMEDGSMVRTMNARDGYALQLSVKLGYEIVIITGGSSTAVKDRLEGLGIKHVYLSASNKKDVFEEHCLSFGTKPEHTLYMGDDIPDYEVLSQVAVSACPKNAAPEIRSICNFMSTVDGGMGCVRDVIEQTLKVQDNWFISETDFDKFTW
jgi:3-deoxy-D-manno-octulosonate 8-phosphate phosphatase (KDO 8-P phosphatase)